MDYEPAEYRKLALKQFPPRALRETAEGKYWKRFANPVNAQQVGPFVAAWACGRKQGVSQTRRPALPFLAGWRRLSHQLYTAVSIQLCGD